MPKARGSKGSAIASRYGITPDLVDRFRNGGQTKYTYNEIVTAIKDNQDAEQEYTAALQNMEDAAAPYRFQSVIPDFYPDTPANIRTAYDKAFGLEPPPTINPRPNAYRTNESFPVATWNQYTARYRSLTNRINKLAESVRKS